MRFLVVVTAATDHHLRLSVSAHYFEGEDVDGVVSAATQVISEKSVADLREGMKLRVWELGEATASFTAGFENKDAAALCDGKDEFGKVVLEKIE